jgi:orotate phosphoribosyltransferase-like protein
MGCWVMAECYKHGHGVSAPSVSETKRCGHRILSVSLIMARLTSLAVEYDADTVVGLAREGKQAS